jgi:DhnA family fructose-bisphosphate aldolase class Ia
MTGAELRLARLFGHDGAGALIIAIDHGLNFGNISGAEDAVGLVERTAAAQPDGVLIAPGLLARAGHLLAYRGGPSVLMRTDFIVLDERLARYGDLHRVLCTPDEALRLGADALVMYLVFGVRDGRTFADNLQSIAHTSAAAHAVGLPLVAEVVLWGSEVEDRNDGELLAFGCRMAAEAGADAIKTQYPGTPEAMAKIVEGCPVPVLVLGGAKADDVGSLLEGTRDAVAAGARGVVYGRNIWQADDPALIAQRLRAIVRGEPAPGR